MIHDERFDATVCGVVTENVLVDTTVAIAQLNAVITQAQALVNELTGEAVVNHATTHAAGGDDPITPASIEAAAASSIHDFTLDADNWNAGEYEITSSDVAGLSVVTADTAVEILPGLSITGEQLEALQLANIQEGGQTAGTITLKAYGDVPTIDTPIRIIVRGDLY